MKLWLYFVRDVRENDTVYFSPRVTYYDQNVVQNENWQCSVIEESIDSIDRYGKKYQLG
jgi:hypothetical protein